MIALGPRPGSTSQPVAPGFVSLADVPLGNVLVVLGMLSLGVSKPQLFSNLVVTDVMLFAMIAIWFAHVLLGRSRSSMHASALVLPTTLILGGSILASVSVGLQGFVINDLARDVGALCGFLAIIDILERGGPTVQRWCAAATAVSVAVLTLWLVVVDDTLRGRGSFPNPNVPAHFLACSVIVFSMLPLSIKARVPILLLGLVGLYRTGSFGAALQILAAISYVVVTGVLAATRNRERTRAAFFVAVGALGVATAVAISAYLGRSGANDASGLSTKRLDRSSSTRFAVWTEAFNNWIQHPFGTGPGSSRALGLLKSATEPHNEPLAYLSERGPIALVGLVLLWFAIWRMGTARGLTRALLCGYLVGSVFRETLHYRHWWFLLAFAVVFDHSASKRLSADD
jgi:O-Antigen ligase